MNHSRLGRAKGQADGLQHQRGALVLDDPGGVAEHLLPGAVAARLGPYVGDDVQDVLVVIRKPGALARGGERRARGAGDQALHVRVVGGVQVQDVAVDPVVSGGAGRLHRCCVQFDPLDPPRVDPGKLRSPVPAAGASEKVEDVVFDSGGVHGRNVYGEPGFTPRNISSGRR